MQLEYSVEADVSPEFAWKFRTDVANWNDPPATFALEGPFEAGASGTTVLPGQPPIHWRIRDITPGKSFTLEMQLDGATLTFEWILEAVSGHRTRLTQRIVLSGVNAQSYAAQVEAGFGPTLADGMKRVAAEMTSAGREEKPH